MEKTKKTIFVGLLASMLFMTGCKSATSDLKLFAVISDRQCPIKVDDYITATGCRFHDNTLTYTCSVWEISGFGRVDEIDLESSKKELLNEWVNSDDSDMEELVDMLINAGASLEYVYIGKPYGDRATITISSQEFAAARKKKI